MGVIKLRKKNVKEELCSQKCFEPDERLCQSLLYLALLASYLLPGETLTWRHEWFSSRLMGFNYFVVTWDFVEIK